MYSKKSILGVITARGGSKGIPRKNIKDLCGKPLIAYTIEEAKKSKYLTRCIVSTDDHEIADISRKYGAEVPFIRPSEFSQDKSTSIDVAQHAIKWIKKENHIEYDYLMILQPTSPLRSFEDVDECIRIAVENNADSVMSMMKLDDFSVQKLKILKKGLICPWLENEGSMSSRRQDLPDVYKRNCAIYLTKIDFILKNDLFGRESYAYIMPEDRSIDINRPIDFELAEFWINKFNK